MHPLFQLPSSEVTLDVVQDFINLKIRESLTVEYKKAGDKPIEAVAALANTYGGLLLVGVARSSWSSVSTGQPSRGPSSSMARSSCGWTPATRRRTGR